MAAPTTNIVRLPNAPKRKVQQPYNRAARAARAVLPQFTGEYRFPSQREADKLAARLSAIEWTPAAELAAAIIATLSEDAKTTARLFLALRKASGWASADAALAIVESANMTVGAAADLRNASRRLDGGARS